MWKKILRLMIITSVKMMLQSILTSRAGLKMLFGHVFAVKSLHFWAIFGQKLEKVSHTRG